MCLLAILLVILISVGRWLLELVILIMEVPESMETGSVDPASGGGEEGASVRGGGGEEGAPVRGGGGEEGALIEEDNQAGPSELETGTTLRAIPPPVLYREVYINSWLVEEPCAVLCLPVAVPVKRFREEEKAELVTGRETRFGRLD